MKNISNYLRIICFVILFISTFSFTNGQTTDEPQILPPNQTVEREMTGKTTHRYKFDLKKGEFFQVRAEQKGVDVLLQITSAKDDLLATMDSPNGKEGVEILTFVASNSNGFILKVISSNENNEKGKYIISRSALRIATDKDKRRVEIERTFVEGIKARDTEGQADIGIAKLEEALKGWQELEDTYLADLTNKNLARLKENKFFATFNRLFQSLTAANNLFTEGAALAYKSKAETLAGRAKLLEALAKYQELKATVYDKAFVEKITAASRESQEPLTLLRNLQRYTKTFETQCLSSIAQTHYNFGEWKEYIDYNEKVFANYQEIIANKELAAAITPENLFIMKYISATALRQIGSALDGNFGKTDEGLTYLEKALEHSRNLFEETKDQRIKPLEAGILRTIASVYGRKSQNITKTIEYFTKALEIYRTIPDYKTYEADILTMIAAQYMGSFQYRSAIEKFEESLRIYRETDNKFGQVNILQMLGVIYSILNNKNEFSKYLNQSLQILQSPDFAENYHKSFTKNTQGYEGFEVYRQVNADFIEYTRLGNIGLVYKYLEDYPKASEYYLKTLEVARMRKESRDVRSSLVDAAYSFGKLEKWNEATNYYLQALEISRTTENNEDIAKDLQDVGWTLLEAGKLEEALKYQNEATSFYKLVGVDEKNAFTPSYSTLLNEISRTYNALKNSRLAIFYGKRAVNAMQGERQRLQNLDLISQRGFLERKEKYYRRLADWLIEAGRIVEAERVLAMLKEEEISDYLRRDKSFAEKLSLRIEYTPSEEKALKEDEKISETITAIGAEFGKLNDLKRNQVKLTEEQEKRFAELKARLIEANKSFQDFLNQLAGEFKKGKDIESEKQVNKALQTKLENWGSGLAFIYTLIGEDRFHTILYTPNTQVEETQKITTAELNQKIVKFREQVKNPQIDPRPLGKELYDILIKPIEKQLEDAKAKTILWSLDGNLRLLPLAALWDGKQYFGQKYQNVVVTPVSYFNLDSNMSINQNILGLGVSQAQTVEDLLGESKMTFSALPAVPSELASIVKTKKSPKGILPGESLLDEVFTKKNLEEQLNKNYKIVHIASHFSLNAGDADKSFLLLGDGTSLTVNEFNNNPSLRFKNVELLTLSACETAVTSTDANGKEIEGFAYVAQTNGAKAILATLWSVADNSTAILMSEFYRIRKANPNLTKAEAVQMAQNAMIEGRLKAGNAGNQKGTKLAVLPNKNNAPSFQPDKNRPFSHPYFWSPFVLIGNWK